MRGLFLFICVSVSLSSLSQVKCIRLSTDGNQPVQYVTATFKKDRSVYISDENGLLCEKFMSKIRTGDTLLFTAIGFEKREVVYSGNDTILLQRRFVVLPEVVLVEGKGKEEIWGTQAKPSPLGYHSRIGFHAILLQALGRIIYPEGDYKKAEIQSVSFYDATGKGINVPVRVRIFLVGKDSLPVADYLNENIIINTKGKGWITADLKEQGLVIPREGLAFCIELFANSDDFYYLDKVKGIDGEIKEMKVYGLSLGIEKEYRNLTLVKFDSWNPWQVLRFPNGNLVCRVKVRVWR